ncbi:hypothetical protein [Chondrinema litorale]|uniref:hypothetical protein n=1 Tax=Chondrinema litorale TaxID=2994555 RepID=UPI00254362A8|nr:hypothetical protein [Chondrinema litorale]UZR98627.1 hypothetical protein OQ292_32885 [Chondrinema litorale]
MRLISFLFIFLLMFSCKDDQVNPDTTEFKIGEEFELEYKIDEKVLSTATNLALEFTLQSVSDSRCPENANCFWAGNTKVNGEIKSKESDEQIELDFCLGDCFSEGHPEGYTIQDTVDFDLDDKSYMAVLKAVTPFPSLIDTADTKTVLVEILEK